jgi:hypothetical protein
MKKRARSFSRRNEAVPKSSQRNAATPQLVQIEKPVYGGAFLARVEGKAVLLPQRSGLRPSAGTLGRAEAANTSTQSTRRRSR